jgi:hypothetical protein
MLPDEQNPDTASIRPDQLLRDELAEALMHYGLIEAPRGYDELSVLYARGIRELGEEVRTRMLLETVQLVESQRISPNVLRPFLFLDPSPVVISTAALHAVPVIPGTTEADPLVGVRALANDVQGAIQAGDEERAAWIVSGMLLLGDRRVVGELSGCWRWFSTAGRTVLAELQGGVVYASLVEWLLDWLEECEAGEFGEVAGTVARWGLQATQSGMVVETERALPIWSRPHDQGAVRTREWTVPEFAASIRPRLLQIAADEAPPRVMFDVLKSWGIDFRNRLQAGVQMRPVRPESRPLLPLLGSDPPTETRTFDLVALESRDFAAADGALLLSWMMFNPDGPTWECLGLSPTEHKEVDLLFYRMLNPFSTAAFAVGVVHGDDRRSARVLGDAVGRVLSLDGLNGPNEEHPGFVGDLPSSMWLHLDDPDFEIEVQRGFEKSPRVLESDPVRYTRALRDHYGDPWRRVTEERSRVIAQLTPEIMRGEAFLPPKSSTSRASGTEQSITHLLRWLRTRSRSGSWTTSWHGTVSPCSGSSQQESRQRKKRAPSPAIASERSCYANLTPCELSESASNRVHI